VSYNAITPDGAIQLASDATVVGAGSTYASYARLGALGSSLALAIGTKDGASGSASAPTYAQVLVIDAATGAVNGSPAMGRGANDAQPVSVGGVIADSSGASIVSVQRRFGVGVATEATTDAFNSTPGHSHDDSPSVDTLATSVGFVEVNAGTPRFGVAYVSHGNAGMVQTYDATLAPMTAFPFTAAGDAPATDDVRQEVAIAGAGGRFVIAWVDTRKTSDIYVTSLDPLTGARLTTRPEVLVSDGLDTTQKYFPRVAFDGQSVIVAWVQGSFTSDYDVLFRRFDLDLTDRDASRSTCVTCGGGHHALATAIGLAAAAPNEFGLAYKETGGAAFFVRASCDGP